MVTGARGAQESQPPSNDSYKVHMVIDCTRLHVIVSVAELNPELNRSNAHVLPLQVE